MNSPWECRRSSSNLLFTLKQQLENTSENSPAMVRIRKRMSSTLRKKMERLEKYPFVLNRDYMVYLVEWEAVFGTLLRTRNKVEHQLQSLEGVKLSQVLGLLPGMTPEQLAQIAEEYTRQNEKVNQSVVGEDEAKLDERVNDMIDRQGQNNMVDKEQVAASTKRMKTQVAPSVSIAPGAGNRGLKSTVRFEDSVNEMYADINTRDVTITDAGRVSNRTPQHYDYGAAGGLEKGISRDAGLAERGGMINSAAQNQGQQAGSVVNMDQHIDQLSSGTSNVSRNVSAARG